MAEAAVDQGRTGARHHRSPLLGLDVDAFFVTRSQFRSGRYWRRWWLASGFAVPGGFRGGIEVPGISDVVVDAGQSRASASDDRGQAREGIRGF